MYERFTDRARRVMQFANSQARKYEQEFIQAEHILIGLVEEGSGVAANVLKNLGIELEEIRRKLELALERGTGKTTSGRLPLAANAKKVIDNAVEESRRLNHNYVGTEHLFLGLLRQEEGVALKVLTGLGLSVQVARDEVLKLLGQNLPDVKIPKALHPKTAETYPVSDLEPADNPTRPLLLNKSQTKLINDWIQSLEEQRNDRVVEKDFEKAARVHEEVEVLKLLLEWYNWSQGKS
jgi:ATP-dependent Clp protease ATP-binding subunit ClpA